MQVERQIDQMVRFIKQEAQEKAHEIQVSAEEVCACASNISLSRGMLSVQMLRHAHPAWQIHPALQAVFEHQGRLQNSCTVLL